ncbi:hypothetical protein ACWEJ6_51245 [Nonomuraea sp. NPDC004702]
MKVLDNQGSDIKEKISSAFSAWHSSHPNATDAERRTERQKLPSDGMATK